jgi:hypothetical protein
MAILFQLYQRIVKTVSIWKNDLNCGVRQRIMLIRSLMKDTEEKAGEDQHDRPGDRVAA